MIIFRHFNLGFLNSLSLPLAILLCTAEFIAGFSVLTGFRQKTGIWVVMILMVIFTPLTFILALNKSCFRLRMFWRCNSSDQLADIWKKYYSGCSCYNSFSPGRKDSEIILAQLTEWIIIFMQLLFFILFQSCKSQISSCN